MFGGFYNEYFSVNASASYGKLRRRGFGKAVLMKIQGWSLQMVEKILTPITAAGSIHMNPQ